MSSADGIYDFIARLNNLEIDILPLIEKDLTFSDLVSLAFLLFGGNRLDAQFILQKLLTVANYKNGAQSAINKFASADILFKYASIKNPKNWRAFIMEGLTIIGARRILMKMGFTWEDLSIHFLPHIPELSRHLNPMIKTLYNICEQLTPPMAQHLVMQINEKYDQDKLQYCDFSHLEMFLLDWITRHIIVIGDMENNGCNIDILLEYLKLNDMDNLKKSLLHTIQTHSKENNTDVESMFLNQEYCKNTLGSKSLEDSLSPSTSASTSSSMSMMSTPLSISKTERQLEELDLNEYYNVRHEYAGIIVIINQKDFYRDDREEFKHLLPKKSFKSREGTDIDKNSLQEVFSSFGYKPEEHDNVEHFEMMHIIRNVVKRSCQYDSLIVCILSHGVDGVVYGCNSIPIKIDDIEEIMVDKSLTNKPKMLIIQACQEGETPTEVKKRNVPLNSFVINYGDMIRAMSTIRGYVSIRHTLTGTWFIQSLCSTIDKYGDKKHMVDMLIKVNREVTAKRGDNNEAMVPETVVRLTKFFRLPQRIKLKT